MTLAPRHPSASETVMTQHVLPQHTNAVGTLFGGQLLAWVDVAAGVCAMRHAGRIAVTASFDEVHFKLPVRHGDIVVLTARLTWTGRTSMEIRVRAEREELSGLRELALEAFTTFVAQDDARRPTPVPPLRLDDDADQACYAAALARRARRLEHAGRRAEADQGAGRDGR
jgi:acyl-CoA hydrolase